MVFLSTNVRGRCGRGCVSNPSVCYVLNTWDLEVECQMGFASSIVGVASQRGDDGRWLWNVVSTLADMEDSLAGP